MKRRSFLAMLGLAPATAAIHTATLPPAEKPFKLPADAVRLDRVHIGTITTGRFNYPNGASIDFDAGTITFR